ATPAESPSTVAYRATSTDWETKPAPLLPAAVLPRGYGTPYDLVGDPNGTGVWFLAQSVADVALFRLSGPTGTLESWPVGSSAELELGLNSGLAVGRSGITWVGVGQSLFRVDTTAGSVTQIALPSVPESAALAKLPGPPEAQTPGIIALAVAPSGSLAIARFGATAIQIYSPSSGTFTTVPLPDNSSPNLAGGNGALAFDSGVSWRWHWMMETPTRATWFSYGPALLEGRPYQRQDKRCKLLVAHS
ncbi:MAG: hypothetical protein ACREKE_07120, partial [bacterium]